MKCPICSGVLERQRVGKVDALACKSLKCTKRRTFVPRFFLPGKDGVLVSAPWIEESWRKLDERQRRLEEA
jgi:hypothetical protein